MPGPRHQQVRHADRTLQEAAPDLLVTGEIEDVYCSPDGKTLATGHGAGQIKLWNTPTGQEQVTLQGNVSGPTSLVFLKEGRTLATVGMTGVVEFWGEGP